MADDGGVLHTQNETVADVRNEKLFVSEQYKVFVITGQPDEVTGRKSALKVRPFNKLSNDEIRTLKSKAQPLDAGAHIAVAVTPPETGTELRGLSFADEMTGASVRISSAMLDADVRETINDPFKRLAQKPLPKPPSKLRRGIAVGAVTLAAIFTVATGGYFARQELHEQHEAQAYTQQLAAVPVTGVHEADARHSDIGKYDTQNFGEQMYYHSQDEAFLKSVDQGDIIMVRALLQKDGKEIVQRSGALAMSRAAQNGDLDMISLLHTAGVDVNATATLQGYYTNVVWNPLDGAIERGLPKTVELLLSLGANANAQPADGGMTPFMKAVNTYYDKDIALRIMEDLRKAGADLTVRPSYGYDALELAVNGTYGLEKTTYILDHLTPEQQKEAVNKTYDKVYSPFYGEKEKPKGLTLLMISLERRGFDSDAKEGWSPVEKLLIAHGADIHAKDAQGFGLMHRAAPYNRLVVVKDLIAKGENPLQKAANGATPGELAKWAFPHPVDVQDYLAARAKTAPRPVPVTP